MKKLFGVIWIVLAMSVPIAFGQKADSQPATVDEVRYVANEISNNVGQLGAPGAIVLTQNAGTVTADLIITRDINFGGSAYIATRIGIPLAREGGRATQNNFLFRVDSYSGAFYKGRRIRLWKNTSENWPSGLTTIEADIVSGGATYNISADFSVQVPPSYEEPKVNGAALLVLNNRAYVWIMGRFLEDVATQVIVGNDDYGFRPVDPQAISVSGYGVVIDLSVDNFRAVFGDRLYELTVEQNRRSNTIQAQLDYNPVLVPPQIPPFVSSSAKGLTSPH